MPRFAHSFRWEFVLFGREEVRTEQACMHDCFFYAVKILITTFVHSKLNHKITGWRAREKVDFLQTFA